MFDVVSDIFSFNVVRKHKQTQRLYLDEVTFKSPQVREIRSWIERAIHRIQQLKAQATVRDFFFLVVNGASHVKAAKEITRRTNFNQQIKSGQADGT